MISLYNKWNRGFFGNIKWIDEIIILIPTKELITALEENEWECASLYFFRWVAGFFNFKHYSYLIYLLVRHWFITHTLVWKRCKELLELTKITRNNEVPTRAHVASIFWKVYNDARRSVRRQISIWLMFEVGKTGHLPKKN